MRKAVYVTAILLIVFLEQPILIMEVEANPYRYGWPNNYLSFLSPEMSETFHTNSVPLEVRATPNNYREITEISYRLDNGAIVPLNFSTTGSTYSVKATLENVTEGHHQLDIYSTDATGQINHTFTYFSVDIKNYYNSLIINLSIVSVFSILAVLLVSIYRKRRLASKRSFS
jgi:hypothetical protein